MTDHFALEGMSRFDRIVHVGAGSGGDLAAWLETGAARIVLVEPDPDTVRELRDRAGGDGRVEVRPAAVTAGGVAGPDARVRLYRFSYADLNAVHPAAAAMAGTFPGLSEAPPVEVARLAPSALAEGIADGETALLVLEAPGEGLAILKALEAEGLLARFGRVVVQEPDRPLYEGGATLGDVEAWLRGGPFGAPVRGGDADRPHLRADRDGRADRIQTLQREIETLRAEIRALQQARDTVVEERDRSRNGHAVTQSQRDEFRTRLEEAEARLATWDRARDDILKAEGQIGLIRELFLRGPAL